MTEERKAEWRNRRSRDIQVGIILNQERKENPSTLAFYSRPNEPWKKHVLQSIVDEGNGAGFHLRRTSVGDRHEIHIYSDAASAEAAFDEETTAEADREALELEEEWYETKRTYLQLSSSDAKKKTYYALLQKIYESMSESQRQSVQMPPAPLVG
jgi:hypothetical protein